MRKIKELVEWIDEELCSAKSYAEKYVEFRVGENTNWASRFKAMAQEELEHASVIHELAVEEIDTLKKIYTPPEEMQEKWEKCHAHYVEKAAWVKQMLSL